MMQDSIIFLKSLLRRLHVVVRGHQIINYIRSTTNGVEYLLSLNKEKKIIMTDITSIAARQTGNM